MIHEIGSNIVTFLLGSALTFFLGKWTNIFTKVDNLEFGVQALLRNRMIQTVNYYREKGKPVPQWLLHHRERQCALYTAPHLAEEL